MKQLLTLSAALCALTACAETGHLLGSIVRLPVDIITAGGAKFHDDGTQCELPEIIYETSEQN